MFSEENLIKTLNKIKDNLWIGDTIEARNLSSEMFDSESDTEIIKEYREAFSKLKDQHAELRKVLKEEYKKSELDYILSKKFSEVIQESQTDPRDAIIGSILDYMQSINERLKDVKNPFEINSGDGYKYSMLNLGSKYEVRMLFSNERSAANIEKMCNKLSAKGFQVRKTIEEKSYFLISTFSSEAYIEIVVFIPRVEFSITLLSPSQENADKITKILVNSLVSES
jgi:hypothetical protein